MRFASTLLIAAVLVATSCTSDPKSAQTTTTAGTNEVGSAAPINTSNSAVECVHTDPGKLPISVHRALSCPDGTTVSVRGIVTRGADGSTMLCDAVPGDVCLKVDGAHVVLGLDSGTVTYTGTVAKGVLNASRSPLLVGA